MVTPNWFYFANAPLDSGTITFRTKTERALHALVIASEINWKENKTVSLLEKWIAAKNEFQIYQNALNQIKTK